VPGFSERPVVLSDLANPSMMDTDGENLYILDGVEAYVYSLKDFRLLHKFGKRGEGPGELMVNNELPASMLLAGEEVILFSFNKIIHFTKTGNMVKEAKLPLITSQVIPFGKNYALSKFTRGPDGVGVMHILLFDGELKELKKLYKASLLNSFKERKIAVPLSTVYIQSSGDKLFVFDQQKDFHIKVFDLEGNELKPLEKTYEKIKTSEDFKKEKMDWLKVQPAFKEIPEEVKNMIFFPEYLPVMRHFLVKDEKMYVETFKRKGPLSEFFILDFKGNTLKNVFLPNAKADTIRPGPAAGYTFLNNKYYYLVENVDEEEWELHVKEL
jgi:hypothetical protein